MNYYCGNCGAEFRNVLEADYTACPLCKHKGLVQKIPEFETPEQYAERTKEYWPDEGPVWCRANLSLSGIWSHWNIMSLFIANIETEVQFQILCAQGPEAPPDNWEA
jgi:DNA-directed RNA polymerase subunit RPC12/RpoP